MELDPMTGEVVDIIGPLTSASGSNVPIIALSVQPETDVLFGFSSDYSYPPSPPIWTIDKSTAAATPVASKVPAGCVYNCSSSSAFGFAADGTLYHIYTQGVWAPGTALMTLDPSTGAELTSVPITAVPGDRPYSLDSLAVRNDGVIFSSSIRVRLPKLCRTCPPPDPKQAPPALSMIDPATGVASEVGTWDMYEDVFGLDFSRVRAWRTAINDLTDGAQYLVDQGVADPARICVVGWSYGGYAALMSGVEEPDRYRCLVSIAGVSDPGMLIDEYRHFLNRKSVRKFIGRDDEVIKRGSFLDAHIGQPTAAP